MECPLRDVPYIIIMFVLYQRLSDTDTDTKNGDLFLPDNLSEKDRVDFKNKKKKLRIRDLIKRPCLGPGCEKMAVRPCLYCSEECIEKLVTGIKAYIVHVHVHVYTQ